MMIIYGTDGAAGTALTMATPAGAVRREGERECP